MIEGFLAEVINFILYWGLSFPGAIIRWIVTGKKKSLQEIRKDSVFNNGLIGILFVSVIVMIIYLTTI